MRILLLAALLIQAASATARAGEPPARVCARSTVLDQVADILRQAGRPLILDRAAAGEVSTTPANIVLCAVRVHRVVYDTNRYAYLPLDQTEIVQYTLELRHNGIFVHLN